MDTPDSTQKRQRGQGVQGRWTFTLTMMAGGVGWSRVGGVTMTMMAGGVGWSRVGGVTMTMMAGGVTCSRVGGRHNDHDGWWGGLVQG